MFSILVFFAWAMVSEAGVLRQPNLGVGLQFQPASSYAILPSSVRSHTAPLIQIGSALHSPFYANTFLSSPVVFNSLPNNHAAIVPKLHPQISLEAISPIPAFSHIRANSLFRSTPLQSSLTSNLIESSRVLNSSPVHQVAHISPPVILNSAPISHVATRPAPTGSHTALPTVTTYFKIIEQEIPEKSVSYSISENDYQYLKRHKIEGQDSPYNPLAGHDTASHNIKYKNSHSHHGEDNSVSNKSSGSDNVIKRSTESNEGFQVNGNPTFNNSPAQLVTKHVYFHVPPPDFEEPAPVPINLPLPKKTYNIMFIKVPSQELQNNAYLQQLIQSRQSQIEDKTLIYVLSKKQDSPQQVVLPPQQISSPEVFFVKYRTKSGDVTDIGNEIVEQSLLENIAPLLEVKQSHSDNALVSFPEN